MPVFNTAATAAAVLMAAVSGAMAAAPAEQPTTAASPLGHYTSTQVPLSPPYFCVPYDSKLFCLPYHAEIDLTTPSALHGRLQYDVRFATQVANDPTVHVMHRVFKVGPASTATKHVGTVTEALDGKPYATGSYVANLLSVASGQSSTWNVAITWTKGAPAKSVEKYAVANVQLHPVIATSVPIQVGRFRATTVLLSNVPAGTATAAACKAAFGAVGTVHEVILKSTQLAGFDQPELDPRRAEQPAGAPDLAVHRTKLTPSASGTFNKLAGTGSFYNDGIAAIGTAPFSGSLTQLDMLSFRGEYTVTRSLTATGSCVLKDSVAAVYVGP